MKKTKTILKVLLVFIIILMFAIGIPMIIAYIITTELPETDTYLITGASFINFFGFSLMMVTLFFVLRYFLKNRKNGKIKLSKNPIILIAIPMLISIWILYRGNLYIKDIIEGPQECIMTDAVIKREGGGGRGRSYRYKISGYIDGKKVKLGLKPLDDADLKDKRNKEYSKVKIVYYKNIKEVCKIEKK